MDEKLQPGAVAKPAISVVAEYRSDAGPHVRHLMQRYPGAESYRKPWIRRQAATDPEVETWTVLGMDDPDEGDVVDLVADILLWRARNGGLVLPRQIGERVVADVAAPDLLDRRSSVDDLVGGDPGHWRAEDHAWCIATGFGGRQADRLECLPDRRDVLDAYPVQLDVLPVGEVGGSACVGRRHLGDGSQLSEIQPTSVDADAQHEVLVVELFGGERGRFAAVNAWFALGVEPPPAKTPTQVGWIDAGEAAMRIDGLDTAPDVQPIVVLLEPLVGVERFEMAEGPLALAAVPACLANRRRGVAARGGLGGGGCGGLDGCHRASLAIRTRGDGLWSGATAEEWRLLRRSTRGAGRIDHAPDGQGGGQTAGIQTMLDTRR
jgi:hypothetical protein